MRRLAVLISMGALVVTGTALADHLDPQKQITASDQARAQAMLLRKADLPAFRGIRRPEVNTHLTCRALDESDLTVTGEAESLEFSTDLFLFSAASQVYESAADAKVSWKRGTSAAGLTCLRQEVQREYAKQGVRVQSLRRIAFPNVSNTTVAYRVELSAESQGTRIPLYLDLIVLLNARAQVALFAGSALTVPVRENELRLARILARRMATAMRGA